MKYVVVTFHIASDAAGNNMVREDFDQLCEDWADEVGGNFYHKMFTVKLPVPEEKEIVITLPPDDASGELTVEAR